MTTTESTRTHADTLHLPMPKRALGRTGWQASLFALGGVKWDTLLPTDDAVALIHRAISLGVNTFDTAAGYGKGQSEERLGIALHGRRKEVWLQSKHGARDADKARQTLDEQLTRLQTDYLDLFMVHSLHDDDDRANVIADDGVWKVAEEYRAAGHIRHLGVSGHWFRHSMLAMIRDYPLDVILCPVGLFNAAYDYDYFSDVIPEARQRGIGIMGMKVFGAGRIKLAADIEPYIRFSINRPIDSAVIGCDTIEQLEQIVRIVKAQPPALSDAEQRNLYDEAKAITQSFDRLEFNWVSHYIKK